MTRRRRRGHVDELARRTAAVLERFEGGIILPHPVATTVDSTQSQPPARRQRAPGSGRES